MLKDKTIKLKFYNKEGKILSTLLSEGTYTEGLHIFSSKLNFPTGAYFILTKIDNIIYSDKIIIAK